MSEPPAAFAAPARAATRVSVLCVVVAVLGSALLPPSDGRDLAVLSVGLLLGLPHGAVDHLVPGFRGRLAPGWLLALVAGYAALAAVAWLGLRAWPAVGLLGFVGLAVVHFGLGEATFARLRAGRAEQRSGPLLAGLASGTVVVTVPVALHAGEVAPYLSDLVPGWDGRLPLPLLVAMSVGTIVLVVAGLVATLRDAAYVEAAELALLTALALVATPAVTLGVYFGTWHAARHVAVLLAEDPRNARALVAGRLGPPLLRFGRAAVLPTLAALVVVGLLWTWSADGRLHRFVAVDLGVLAALTVPHTVVVWWLDRQRGSSPATPRPVRATERR